MANKSMKICSTSLAIGEIKIKTKCIVTQLLEWLTLKKQTVVTPNTGEHAEKLGHSNVASGNVKWYSHSGGKKLAVFFQSYTYT